MPERPVRHHYAFPQHRANDALWPRPDNESAICLTLRIGSPDSAHARGALEYLLRNIPDLCIMTVSHRRGVATLAVQAPRHELDAILHGVMSGVPGAEFGPVQPAALAAVH